MKKKINELKVGATLSYISMGLSYIISIIYTPIMLRLLGQSEYGLYNLVSSTVSYLGLLSFGFASSYMRFYSKYKVNKDEEGIAKLNGMFLFVFSVIGVIALLAGSILVLKIGLIFGDKLTIDELNTAKTLMSIMIFNIAISFPTTIFNSYIIANEKYIFQKLLQMAKFILNPFIILPVLLIGYKSIGMVIATTFFTIIMEMINIYFCFNKLSIKFKFKNLELSLIKEISIFSSYIFMNMIIDQINWNADKYLLGRFRGTIAVAVYGLAAQLNTYYMSISTVISSVFIPRVNKIVAKSNNNQILTDIFIKIGRIQFILLSYVGLGIVFLGKPFIYLWAGKDYKDAYLILLFLMIPSIIPLMQNIGIEIQRAKNMHKFRAIVYFIIAIGNLAISIPISRIYGGKGAALATGVSLFISSGLIMNFYYHYKIKIDMKLFWFNILQISKSLIIPILSGVILCIFINIYNFAAFFLSAIVYTIIFAFSVYLLGMNEYEKCLLDNTFKIKDTFMKITRLIINLFLVVSSYVLKRKNNWIVFGSWLGESYVDNPRYVYEYLLDKGKDYKLIWIGKESIKDMVPQGKNTLFIKKGSIRAFFYLLKCKYIFISQSLEGDITSFVVHKGAILVHCWHGVPVKKIGSHMKGEYILDNNIKKKVWSIHKNIFDLPINYNYFLSSSPKNDYIFKRAFSYMGANQNNILQSGYPRNDMFFNYSKSQVRYLKEKYSEIFGFSIEKKVILYLPTYRRKTNMIESLCSRNEKESQMFYNLLGKHNAVLLEKNHFQTYKEVDMIYDTTSSDAMFKIHSYQNINVQELLLITDILISDYSGAYLDFTLLDRPVIHYAYDYNYYRDIDSGLYYDIEEFAAGRVASTFEELLEELEALLLGDDKYKNKRKQIKENFMTYENGNACKYIYDKVLQKYDC